MEKIATVRLARDLELPALELACEVSTFVGNRGGGKTNGAVVAAEQLLDAGVQVVVLDYRRVDGIQAELPGHLPAEAPTAQPRHRREKHRQGVDDAVRRGSS